MHTNKRGTDAINFPIACADINVFNCISACLYAFIYVYTDKRILKGLQYTMVNHTKHRLSFLTAAKVTQSAQVVLFKWTGQI